MQQFKVGDWVRDTRQGMKNPIVQLKSNCIALTNPKEYATQYELWQPKDGEWCWSKKRNELTNNVCELIRFYWDNANIGDCEPFIGELPTFLKDK